MGRPPSDNPKTIQFKIRITPQLAEDIEYCCDKTGLSRTELIEGYIQQLKSELEAKVNKSDFVKTVTLPISSLPQKEDIVKMENIIKLIKDIIT